MIAASRKTFKEYGIEDRVTLVEGPADQTYVERMLALVEICVV